VAGAFIILLHQAATGSLFALLAAPEGFRRRGFLKVIAFTALALEGIIMGISSASVGTPLWTAGFSIACLLFTGSLFLLEDAGKRFFLYRLLVSTGILALVASALPFRITSSLSLNDGLLLLNFFLSALLLGSVTTGMLLGHWYLIEPGLSITPLKRLVTLYLLSTLAQGFFILVNLGLLASTGGQPGVSLFLSRYGAILVGRIGIGILASIILGILVWETLKIPHTQAATGLLYVAVVMALVGEFLGRYLLAMSSVPL